MIPTGATVLPVLPPRRAASAVRPLVVRILQELCGNGQQHFQGDTRDDLLSLSLYFLFMLQEKVGKS